MVLDVDDHFHPRQMGRQRAPVRSALRSLGLALGGSRLILLFLAGGLDLLGFLKPQQQLILGKSLGAAAEAVTLQFLDDLDQPSILDVAREDTGLPEKELRELLDPGKLAGGGIRSGAGGGG